MKPKILLRIASIIMFLHLLAHLVGASTWKNNPDTKVRAVIQDMVDNAFMFMGANQSLATHMEGYGYASALALFAFSTLLWMASGVNDAAKKFATNVVLLVSVMLVLWGIVELIYFFPFAASFSLIAGALGLYSFAQWRKA